MLQASDGLAIFLFCACAHFSVALDLLSSCAGSVMDFSPLVRAFLGSRGEGFALMAVTREVIGMKVRRDQIWERLVQMSMYTKCGEVGSVITDSLEGIASTLFETISEVAIA
jgi:hypothetical protein